MATAEVEKEGLPPGAQLPEWEVPKGYPGVAKQEDVKYSPNQPPSHQNNLGSRLDRYMPSYRKYCGLRRLTFLILLGTIALLLLALVIGLSVGLTRRSGSSIFLPLPSGHAEYTGDLTYYGTGLGACGVTSSSSDNIVSISHFVFDAVQVGTNPNTNPLCGLQIRAERFDEQVNAMRSVDLTIVDRCTGCQPTDIDVTTGVFAQLADMAKGRVDVTWAYLNPTPTPAPTSTSAS